MEKVVLIRKSDDGYQTLGALNAAGFSCVTLELPWKNNANNVSCIPSGVYTCKWTRSNRLSTHFGKDIFTYEVLGVTGRSGIRIHSANFAYQLLGCISLGSSFADIDSNGRSDVIESRDTVKKFNSILGGNDFELTVVAPAFA